MLSPTLANSPFAHLFFDEPSPTDVVFKSFNRWLRERPNEFIKLYHGTAATHPVMDKGLLPTCASRRKSYQSAEGFVYLSAWTTHALQFGEIAYPYSEVVLYEVEVCFRRLSADRDQLNNKRVWAGIDAPPTLAHSLVLGRGARVRGKIDPFQIRKAKVTKGVKVLS